MVNPADPLKGLPERIGPTAEKHYLESVWKEIFKSLPDVKLHMYYQKQANILNIETSLTIVRNLTVKRVCK